MPATERRGTERKGKTRGKVEGGKAKAWQGQEAKEWAKSVGVGVVVVMGVCMYIL